MNAIFSLESILEPQQALTAVALFGTGQAETILAAIESQVRAEAYDIATPEGRERIKSVAYKIARSKTTLDDIGKEHVAAIKAQSAKIDAERKTIRDRLDALKEEVRGPLTAWEEAEARRVADHEGAIVAVIEAARQAAGKPASLIRELIQIVAGYAARDWQEFKERAEAAVADAVATLNQALAAAEQHERDQAELAELRRLKAEREEADRKAEAARIAAEQETARKAYEERRERERAEKAEREKAEAVARAIEAERIRAELEKAAAIEAEQRRHEQAARDAAARKAAEEAAERKRQENKRHRQKVRAEISNSLTMEGGLTEEQMVWLFEALDAGRLPHVSINY